MRYIELHWHEIDADMNRHLGTYQDGQITVTALAWRDRAGLWWGHVVADCAGLVSQWDVPSNATMAGIKSYCEPELPPIQSDMIDPRAKE